MFQQFFFKSLWMWAITCLINVTSWSSASSVNPSLRYTLNIISVKKKSLFLCKTMWYVSHVMDQSVCYQHLYTRTHSRLCLKISQFYKDVWIHWDKSTFIWYTTCTSYNTKQVGLSPTQRHKTNSFTGNRDSLSLTRNEACLTFYIKPTFSIYKTYKNLIHKLHSPQVGNTTYSGGVLSADILIFSIWNLRMLCYYLGTILSETKTHTETKFLMSNESAISGDLVWPI